MKVMPILFSTEMVQAIMDYRKTQTRRIIKLTPGFSGRQVGESGNPDNPLGFMYPCGIKRPPCNKGDILWVRETWQCVFDFDNSDQPIEETERYIYYADSPMPFDYWVDADTGEHKEQMPWKPSIHMPKEAARIFLRVKEVRVERLQGITETQALMEGCYMYRTKCEIQPGRSGTAIEDFHRVWDSTIKRSELEKYGWDANPWVWVIEFERCEKPGGWPLNDC